MAKNYECMCQNYKFSDDAVLNYDAEPQINFSIAKLTVGFG